MRAAHSVLSLADVVTHFVAADLALPKAGRLVGLHRGAAELRAQNPRGGKRIVADCLRLESEAGAARQQAVLVVAGEQLRRQA